MMVESRETYHNLETLIDTFGARPATSEWEARLRDYLARRLKEQGIAVHIQPFRSVPSFTLPWITVSVLFLLAGVLGWARGWIWAVLAGGFGLALYWGLVSGKWDVMRLFPQRESANLIARIPPKGERRRLVVLIAHIDSTRATLLWHPKTVRNFGISFRIQTFLLALLFVGAGIGLMGYGEVGRWLMVPEMLISLWGVLVLLHREMVLDWVQGANDNGSGTAVVLTLLERLAQNPPEHTEVWGVFTGCEEVGRPAGAFAFEHEFGWELQDAEFLIIDHVGLGKPRYLVAEGMLPRQYAHPEMVHKLQQLGQRHPEWELDASAVPYGAYTDALPFLMKNYKAVAIWCEIEPGIPPNWHWATDVLENISPEDLERVRTLIESFIREA